MSDFFAAYEGNEPFVFVSYAHKDTDIVLSLIRGLHARGVRVWYDGGLELTEEWLDCIANHLDHSTCVLTFVSRNFEASANCRQEISYAIEEKKGVAVIYLEPRENLKPRTRMQLGPLHAMFYYKYSGVDAFLDALLRAEIIQPCIGAAEEEVPSEPQPMPFATIEFADEEKGEPSENPAEMPVKTSPVIPDETLEDWYRKGKALHQQEKCAEAVVWYRKAAERGHAAAQFELGNCYYYANDVQGDISEAIIWYRKAAEQGHPDAQCMLGNCYELGLCGEVDKTEAQRWYRKAAEQGHADGCFIWAGCLVQEEEYTEALEWYRKAAEQGHEVAARMLEYCAAGLEMEREKWFNKAEKLYAEKKYEEAIVWYRKAAKQGHMPAQNVMGYAYNMGEGVPRDRNEAVKWYRAAAEQGYAKAQFNLGICYQNGRGVPKDDTEAAKWYRAAAEQGYAKAQYNLGNCYHNGWGVPKDYTEAAKWYRKAAEQGIATSQHYLGYCYFMGEGVQQDKAEAVKWYRKAAEQENKEAQYSLGTCYETGSGIAMDIKQALLWYRKAKANGFDSDEAIARCEKALKKPWWKL